MSTFPKSDSQVSPASRVAPRSDRFPSLVNAPADAHARLDELSVGIVGCGSVGSRVALHLARLQPRSLLLIDPARLKPQSVLTHPIGPSDVGALKAATTARHVQAISPASRVSVFPVPVQEVDLSVLASVQAIVLASDNLQAEVDTGQVCLHIAVPLAHAAVSGETLIAQVRFFDNQDPASPCPACGFGPVERRLLQQQAVFPCDGSGSSAPRGAAAIPTRSFSFLCSLAADLAVNQVLRHVLDLGTGVGRTMVQFCGYTCASQVFALVRRQSCPCDHSVWSRASCPIPLARATLRVVARAAGIAAGSPGAPLPPGISFSVGRLRFFEEAFCCGASHRVGLFGSAGDAMGRCPVCRETLRPGPFHGLSSAPGESVPADVPLASLCPVLPDHVVVREGVKQVLVL